MYEVILDKRREGHLINIHGVLYLYAELLIKLLQKAVSCELNMGKLIVNEVEDWSKLIASSDYDTEHLVVDEEFYDEELLVEGYLLWGTRDHELAM